MELIFVFWKVVIVSLAMLLSRINQPQTIKQHPGITFKFVRQVGVYVYLSVFRFKS